MAVPIPLHLHIFPDEEYSQLNTLLAQQVSSWWCWPLLPSDDGAEAR